MGCRGVMDFSISPTWLLWRPAPGPGRSGRRGHRGRHGKGFTFTTVGCTKPTAIDVGARKSKPSLLTHSYSKTLRAWRSIVPMDHVYTHTHAHTHTPTRLRHLKTQTHTQGRFSKHWEKNRETANDTSPRRSENEWAKAIECWGVEVRIRSETDRRLHLLAVSKHKHRHKHTHTQPQQVDIIYIYNHIYIYIDIDEYEYESSFVHIISVHTHWYTWHVFLHLPRPDSPRRIQWCKRNI